MQIPPLLVVQRTPYLPKYRTSVPFAPQPRFG